MKFTGFVKNNMPCGLGVLKFKNGSELSGEF
jgi:hypothetical protein